MTSPALRPQGQAAAQVELLAQLGLPASASPEDLDELHQAVSEYLAAAPSEIRGWAHAQVAALDTAYITLTDPVGLGGSALMSPASPPTVVPGGPATPPARRGPAPAAVAPVAVEAADEADGDIDIEGEPSVEDLAALYAMVTPSVHDDMKPDVKRARPARPAAAVTTAPAVPSRPAVPGWPTAAVASAPQAPNAWKRATIGLIAVVVVAAAFIGVNAIVNGQPASAGPAATAQAQASSNAPAVDMNKVGELMQKLDANDKDVATLIALGDEYYAGGVYDTSSEWFGKALAVDPKNVKALLAIGAIYFNENDLAKAESTWKQVVGIDADNVEVHYDLGFLYMNQPTPDWTKVQSEWGRVVALDPGSDLAKTVQAHLDQLVMASMIPAGSPGASAAPSGAPATSPAASPAASAPASPAASSAP